MLGICATSKKRLNKNFPLRKNVTRNKDKLNTPSVPKILYGL